MILLFSVLAAICFSSCYEYWPVNCDIPLMEEKGDCRIDASLSAFSENVSVTYSPVEHLALQSEMAVFLYVPYHFRQGVGYYTHLGSGVGEVYVGYGMELGRLYTEDVQLNYGWNGLCNGKMDIGFGLRGSKFEWYSQDEGDDEPIEYWENRFSMHTIEPQAMIRLGGEHLKFSMNFVYCFFVGDKGPHAWPFNVSLGVNYRF